MWAGDRVFFLSDRNGAVTLFSYDVKTKAVREAIAAGKLKGNEKLPAKMVLTIGGVSLTHEIAGEIELG